MDWLEELLLGAGDDGGVDLGDWLDFGGDDVESIPTGDSSVYEAPETSFGDQELDDPSTTVTGGGDPIAGPGVGSEDPTGGDRTGGPGGRMSTLDRLLSSAGDIGSRLAGAALGAAGSGRTALQLFNPPDTGGPISPLSTPMPTTVALPAAPPPRAFTPYNPEMAPPGALERLLRGRG